MQLGLSKQSSGLLKFSGVLSRRFQGFLEDSSLGNSLGVTKGEVWLVLAAGVKQGVMLESSMKDKSS
eukprot:CAMPEP_0202430480 /NCGR_PEP_ID=MMETSP1345-20130828/3904_1 /ASSEMBLY_ACC=CAM_ASM_000843 /TAXON_ID=342563 /ORGANISM="Fabrea Fabrea salina" /LENGTH=66 /DNA_ID=CAMNT_0049041967 /DNA_START=20 /DNA_END=220 /DNA_ORIENTATION=+